MSSFVPPKPRLLPKATLAQDPHKVSDSNQCRDGEICTGNGTEEILIVCQADGEDVMPRILFMPAVDAVERHWM